MCCSVLQCVVACAAHHFVMTARRDTHSLSHTLTHTLSLTHSHALIHSLSLSCSPSFSYLSLSLLLALSLSRTCAREYKLFYRALLQKRPIILRSLLIEATPYLSNDSSIYLSIDLSIYTYILHASAFISTSKSTTIPVSTSASHLSNDPSIGGSINQSIHPSTYPSIYL